MVGGFSNIAKCWDVKLAHFDRDVRIYTTRDCIPTALVNATMCKTLDELYAIINLKR